MKYILILTFLTGCLSFYTTKQESCQPQKIEYIPMSMSIPVSPVEVSQTTLLRSIQVNQ